MFLRSGVLIVTASLLAACSSSMVTSVIKPYRIDVRQGNAVTPELVSRLTPGMTREQVRFVMGSPMLVSIFRPDRWDYVYRYSHGYDPVDTHRVTLSFEGDRLVGIESNLPTTVDPDALPERPRSIDITDPAASAPKS